MKQNYSNELLEAIVKPLFDAMANRVTEEEMVTIHLAYEFAREAHSGQWRKSGEPYIIHPIAVARIVGEEMMLGANPVCAAFLHDVVEDTEWTIEQIREKFGTDIAFLVDVVTKKPKKQYDETKQVDNFRQLIYSVNLDIRALLIKLADRLHNMRTLESMRADKKFKIAGETDYFYSPIANRLGLYEVKIELENLSFKYRCPREFEKLENLLAEDKAKNEAMLSAFMGKISDWLSSNGIKTQIEAAYRKPFSIRRKMQHGDEDFQHIDNRFFVRVVFDENQGLSEKSMALRIYALLTDICKEKPGSFINYIDTPKENGYQSLHVMLLAEDGQWIEVHISSARMRLTSRLGCIAEREEGHIARWIKRFRGTLQDIAEHGCDMNLMDGVRASFYNDNIVVYTPKGDAVTLPKNATALDFAFEIHTDVGMHAKYARVNGKLCSVKKELKRGDCVTIGTSEDALPDESWMHCVNTFKAKRHLRGWMRGKGEPVLERYCDCHPLPGDEVIGFEHDDGTIEIHKRDCAMAISIASQNGDSVVAVDFQPDENVLYPVSLHIHAIDRKHLLCELIDCITNQLCLSIDALHTVTCDHIVDCDINFDVHSYYELETVIASLAAIENVDEVWQQEVKPW